MGKGDARRPSRISDHDEAVAYCRTFGHRPGRNGRICMCCGARLTDKDLTEKE